MLVVNRRPRWRIAVVGPARFPVAVPFAGGMEKHTHTLARGLRELGHEVTIFAAADPRRPHEPGVRPMRPVPAPAGGRLDVLTDTAAADAENDSYLEAMVHLATHHYDVVHINAVHYVPYAAREMITGPVTGTLHTPPYPWLQQALTSGRPLPLAAVSTVTARAWADVGVPADVIENGVDLDEWPSGPGGGPAVWSGRLVPEKAPHLAIAAARQAGMALTLYGAAHDPAYFDTHIAPELGGGITYGGHLAPHELAHAVGRASVAVVTPGWDEPFGLVVAEALACGTPVAAFARGALPDLLDDRTGVLAPPDDVDGLARAIRLAGLLDRGACRAAAESRFSSVRMVERYADWFTAAIAATATTRAPA